MITLLTKHLQMCFKSNLFPIFVQTPRYSNLKSDARYLVK